MTSASVMESNVYLTNVTNSNQVISKSGIDTDSFAKTMENTVNSKEEVQPQKETKAVAKTKVENTGNKPKTEVNNEDTKVDDQSASSEEVVATTEEKLSEITKAIADELNVSEEEVLAAMETLGMQSVDLLNPEMLSQLVVTLSEETDLLSLVTDENLYQSLTQLVSMVGESVDQICKEFGITPEELEQMLKEATMQTNTSDLEGATEEKSSVNLFQSGETIGAEEENPLQNQSVKGTENAEGKIPVGEEKPIIKASETSETITKTITTEEPSSQQSETDGEPSFDNHFSFTQEMVKQTAENTVKAATEFQLPLEKPDTDLIMKQVMDSMKLNTSPGVTEMELQLHPASLGTINLTVALKDGSITAQFTAQNEAVKEILESQMLQLRETLNNQGIKVEAIEVTIESHGFERNLDQGNGSGQQMEDGKKQNQRRINLDSMGFMEETVLTDEEQMAVEIMTENGNTIDFTA